MRHAWAGAVDATVDWHGLRLWAEATVGSSWLVADPNRDSAIFVEARTVLAYRLGGAHEGARYLEPYTQLGLLEPDTRIADDLVIEATGGINAGRWQRWRVQLELELWRIDANAPVGITQALTRATDHTAVLLQVAAAFGK